MMGPQREADDGGASAAGLAEEGAATPPRGGRPAPELSRPEALTKPLLCPAVHSPAPPDCQSWRPLSPLLLRPSPFLSLVLPLPRL